MVKSKWKTQKFIRMWPRALFHSTDGKAILDKHMNKAGVYVLYREDKPYYIGKTGKPLCARISEHALKPNARRYNFWNYFSAFQITNSTHRDEVEAILISAMPTAANSARPKFEIRTKLKPKEARILLDTQSLIMTGQKDMSGEGHPEIVANEDR